MRITFLHEYASQDDGVAAVEFALISGVFITFLVGVYVSGLSFLTWNTLQYGTETAARYAAVHENTTEDELKDIVMESLSIVSNDPDAVDITVADTVASGISFREVTATYQFSWGLPFLPDSINNLTLSSSSRMAVD